jgi:mono/diheme cytochrome c family protein
MKKPLLLSALATFALVLWAQINTKDAPLPSAEAKKPVTDTSAGRLLFLKNCAHCHGADAHGDDGPDLHNLDWTDEQITTRIRNGKKGQMTAFTGKLSADQINQIKDYVRTLK